MGTGVLIGMPSNGRKVSTDVMIGFVQQMYPPGTVLEYVITRNAGLCEARNAIVRAALKNNRNYIWFVDDDIILPPGAFARLSHGLGHLPQAGAIGGIYCTKTDPSWPLIFDKMGNGPMHDWKLGELFQVEGIGTGCFLISTEVFKKIPEPWFEFKGEIPQPGEQWIDKEETISSTFLGEDLGFCMKLREAGCKVYAHGGVLCGHIDDENWVYGVDAKAKRKMDEEYEVVRNKAVKEAQNQPNAVPA